MNEEAKAKALIYFRTYLEITIKDCLLSYAKRHGATQKGIPAALSDEINQRLNTEMRKHAQEELEKIFEFLIEKQKEITDPVKVMEKIKEME